MDKEIINRLSNQIWTTRISRVNAEKRLIAKENFFQWINIYYSCLTIIFSILSLYNKDDDLSLMTVFMTISLLVVILYLNGQKYLEHAREYRKNYTELQKLEFELNHVNGEEELRKIEERYCELMDSSSNHISYDYYKTVHGSNKSYRAERWQGVKCKYYWNVIWRVVIKFIIIVLPILLYTLCEVF